MHSVGNAKKFAMLPALILAIMLLTTASWGQQAPIAGSIIFEPTPIDGATVTKYVDPLPHFAGNRVTGTTLAVKAKEFQQKVLPSSFYNNLTGTYKAGTYVWGYQTLNEKWVFGPNYPGFTVEATRGKPTKVTYLNELPLQPLLNWFVPIDQTLHWANPLGLDMDSSLRFFPYFGTPPIVAHLHGAEVPSDFDGGPEQWYTPDGIKGPAFRSSRDSRIPNNGCVFIYPNGQEPTTLWFHDHALGATRNNVYRGLANFYLLRDWYNPKTNPNGIERPDLPGGPNDVFVKEGNKEYKPEIELAIQDRMFDTNGQLFFPTGALNPEHPLWLPEFFGDVMVVNGKTWPFFNVEPRRYRFRTLDGCNARFLNMWLEKKDGSDGPAIWQIGSDGGLLDSPVKLSRAESSFLFLAPGERADIIIDFRGFEGKTLTLRNDAATPFPTGDPVDVNTTGQIMQFKVGKTISHPCGPGGDPSYNPASGKSPRMKPIVQIDPDNAKVLRQLTLNEIEGAPQTVDGVDFPGGPLEILVNNTKWTGQRPDPTMGGMLMPIPGFKPDGIGNYLSELPKDGSTEIWEIANLTMDAHPIHLHLVQFQLLARQDFDVASYFDNAYSLAFPGGQFIPFYGPPMDYFKKNKDGAIGGNPPVSPYLLGSPQDPLPEETGWKDTVKMHPMQVTWIVVRFKTQENKPFPFDATGTQKMALDRCGKLSIGPGYVWHCHIIDHEDNEMMRPYNVVK